MENENQAKDLPQEGDYKGHPILTLNPNSRYPFSFGVSKAKLILEYLEEIKAFIAKHEDAKE